MSHYAVWVSARSRARGMFECAARWGAALSALLTLLLASPAQATTYYTYDSLGRITQAVESDGTTTQYTYDANGNITSINRIAGTTTLSIGSLSVSSGAVGSSITINGSGFSSIASQDIVTLNGVAAQVTYASQNRLVVSIPAGASSGDIQVATQNGSIISSNSFTAVPVSISSFAPTSAVAGAVVTINGGGFDPTPANNTVLINGVAATVSSATTTQLQITVPSGATPGHISVTAPLGSGTSAGDFFVPASGYTLSQVTQVAALVPGGAGQVFPINNANQVGVVLFDGVAGQHLSMVTTNLSAAMHYTVFAPDGSILASNVINSSSPTDLPPLPQAGTYAWYYLPSVIPGSATFSLLTDVVGDLPVDGTPTATSLLPGQSATYTFAGTAGQSYNLTLTPFNGSDEVDASIFNPDGSFLRDCGGFQSYYNSLQHCNFSLGTTGTYFVRITPSFNALVASSFNTYVVQDFSATLTAGTPGPSVGVTLVPNQHGLLSFTATANQTLALQFGPASITPNNLLQFSVSGPINPVPSNIVGPNSLSDGQGTTYNFNNLPAGTYQVLAEPYSNGSAVSMQAVLANGVTATLPVNGTTSTPFQTYVPGQAIYFTLAGTAGQNLGIALTQLALTPSTVGNVSISIYKPDGSYYTSATCYAGSEPGCQMSLRNLPETGTYQVVINPGGAATMELAMTVSQDVSGTLILGTPSTVTVTSTGQNALYTFTASGSQPVVLTVGSITTVPTNTPVTVYIYDANGNLLQYQSMTLSGTVNLAVLPAGTYSLLIVPANAATGSLQLALSPGITGTITTDGTPSGSLTLPNGESAYLSFTGTAGQGYSLALTGLTTTPTNGSVAVSFLKPDGTSFVSTGSCTSWTSSSGNCDISNLPVSGTYTIVLTPSRGMTVTFNAVLSTNLSGTLTVNATPVTYNATIPGENIVYTFAGTAGQKQALVYSGNTIPSGTIYVTTPSGSVLTNTGNYAGSSSGYLRMTLPTTGTYAVIVFADGVSTGQMNLNIVTDAAGTLTGSANYGTAIALAPAQNGSFTFSGIGGQGYSLVVTNMSPSNGSVNATILNPDGSTFDNCGSYSASSGNCDFTLPTTGTYSVYLSPNGTAAISFNVVLSPDLSGGALTIGAAPITWSTSVPGQNMRYTFAGTAGQSVEFIYTNNTISRGTIYIIRPDSSVLTNTGNFNGAGSGYFDMTPNITGTYTAIIFADGSSTGQMSVQLAADVVGSATSDGTATAVSLGTAESGSFTFGGLAGQGYSLALSNMTRSGGSITATILNPNGSTLTSCGSYSPSSGNCDFTTPSAGTYTIRLTQSGIFTNTFNLIVSPDLSDTLTLNAAPVTYTATVSGQNMRYALAGTAGERITLVWANNSIPRGTIYFIEPNGAVLWNSGNFANGPNSSADLTLPAAGTYTVIVFVDGNSTGSISVNVITDVTGAVATDGTPQQVVLNSAQKADYTFSGSAGVTYNLALTNISTVPAGGTINFGFTQPNGSSFSSGYYCSYSYSATGGSCDISPLPATGTYTIRFVPGNAAASASFDVVLAQSANVGALTPNGSLLTYGTTIPGQNGELNFAGSSGQTLSVAYSANTIPNGTLSVWDPNGNWIAGLFYNGTSSGTLVVPALTSTGTYTVRVFADGNSTGQMTVGLVTR